jgi:hypothetical protein
LTAREYIEAVARELGKVRGGGLLLSPADASLALSWHAAQVPLTTVLGEVRKAVRLKARAHARGATEPPISLQQVARAVDVRAPSRSTPPRPEPRTLGDQLRAASRAQELAAREAWSELAETAEDLLALHGGEGYWTAAVRALKASLRELPRDAALKAGAALRARLAPRPSNMPRRRYQRSLQLMLLDAASQSLGVPPRAFLL